MTAALCCNTWSTLCHVQSCCVALRFVVVVVVFVRFTADKLVDMLKNVTILMQDKNLVWFKKWNVMEDEKVGEDIRFLVPCVDRAGNTPWGWGVSDLNSQLTQSCPQCHNEMYQLAEVCFLKREGVCMLCVMDGQQKNDQQKSP